jgi:Rrf2 family protein
MAANTRMATAIQILCVVAYKGADGTNSEVVARSLRTNPVVVRRIMKCLQQSDIVTIRPGKDGGVHLARPPAKITLDQIYRAVEDDSAVFALRPRGNPNCPVDSRMQDLLTPIFRATDGAVEKTLRQTTLASLVKAIG